MAKWKRYFEEIPWMPYPAMPGNHEHRFDKEQMMTSLTSATTEDLILEFYQRMRPVPGKRQERRDVMDRIAKAVSMKVFQRVAHVMVDLQVRRSRHKMELMAKAYGGTVTRRMMAHKPVRKPKFDVMGHRRNAPLRGIDWGKEPAKSAAWVKDPETGNLEIHNLEDILRLRGPKKLTTVLKL